MNEILRNAEEIIAETNIKLTGIPWQNTLCLQWYRDAKFRDFYSLGRLLRAGIPVEWSEKYVSSGDLGI